MIGLKFILWPSVNTLNHSLCTADVKRLPQFLKF